jgi:acetyltransferase-like isoleucine patch superfamily enzyme
MKQTVTFEKNTWIGANVTIVPGVFIGEGAIIGAGSVLATDVPKLAIVGSPPVRILSSRDNEHYQTLEKEKKYGGVSGKLYEGEK